jgi:hypothetical protein
LCVTVRVRVCRWYPPVVAFCHGGATLVRPELRSPMAPIASPRRSAGAPVASSQPRRPVPVPLLAHEIRTGACTHTVSATHARSTQRLADEFDSCFTPKPRELLLDTPIRRHLGEGPKEALQAR